MRRFVISIILTFSFASTLLAQSDKKEVRLGNRAFQEGDMARAEIDYRRALTEDSTSVFARYNLGNVLYKRQSSEEAEKIVRPVLDSLDNGDIKSAAFHNLGNYALDGKKYKEAIDYYKDALRLNPGDYETKSNLAYAQKMLKNEEGGGGGDQNQDKDDQNKDKEDQSQDKKDQDQKQNNQDQNQEQNQPPPKITPQDAQQMLQAIQNKENETQEKVSKEKANALQSRQREKNW
jgi:Tfp pilus assembly protein PilF